MNNALLELVEYIKNTDEYKKCISIKEKMESNEDITSKVNKIKRLQKQYIRTNKDEIKNELDLLEEELNNIPIYYEYLQSLNKVNQMISYVNDELNDYFYNLLNK